MDQSFQPTPLFAQNPSWFAQAPATSFAPPLSVAPPASNPWYKSRTAIYVLLVVLVLLAIAYHFRRRMFFNRKEPSPYAAAIQAIPNLQRQADMREWASFWQLSRRPNVKRVLTDVLNAELAVSPPAPSPTSEAAGTVPSTVAGTVSSTVAGTVAAPAPAEAPIDATTDPAFTVQ